MGAARFARGMSQVVDPEEISIISNVGDDEVIHGLHISPDIDTMIYTLAGAINPETGWGLKGETWHTMEALAEYDGITWFRLGDRDLATHLFRTQLLTEGESLTEITDKIRKRWKVKPRILPVTDDSLKTVLYTIVDGEERKLSFQEYFVQYAHRPTISRIDYEHLAGLTATTSVIETLEAAEVIIIAPSNPVLSIAPILAVPGIAEILAKNRDKVVAISPIIAGEAVKGPAAKLMAELGLGPSALGVANYYRKLISAIVIDHKDSDLKEQIELSGMRALETDTLMRNAPASMNLAASTLKLVIRDLN
ncbi:MAG: 2-phospho-L-lactate transferase [Acidimicrobiaceae bacterium]|nr:2-phospho-L-lactate transferase [Acidimicrobiaceae bacterium]